MRDDSYVGMLLEEIRNQNKVVMDAVTQMRDKVNAVATQENLDRVEAKVDTIQAAVTETNKDVADQGRRITLLEQMS